MAPLTVTVRKVDSAVPVIDLVGEVDINTAPQLKEVLVDLFENGCYRIVINLREVAYMDSSALGVIAGAMKRAAEHEGSIRLVAPGERVRRKLTVTRLYRIIEVFENEEAALSV